MEFLLSQELDEFGAGLRRLLAAEIRQGVLREYCDPAKGTSSFSAEESLLWNKLAQLGAFIAPLPEQHGGLDFGLLAAALLLEEAGRALLPLPLYETLTFGFVPLSLLAAPERQLELLPLIAQGELRLTAPFADGSLQGLLEGGAAEGGVGVKPNDQEQEDTTHLAHGTLPLVPCAAKCHGVLFAAVDESDPAGSGVPALFLLRLQGQPKDSVAVEAVPALDLVHHHGRLTLKGARVQRLSTSGIAPQRWQEAVAVMRLMAAAELSGIAAKVVEITTDYVKTRKQFNRPIGSFQAVQHQLAQMHLQSEEARTLVRFAAWAYDRDRSQFAEAAAGASAYAREVVPTIAERSIQLHGGIGFTFEYDLHLYLRRALLLGASFGPLGEAYESLGRLLLEKVG